MHLDKIIILLSTYNGEKYLKEQLDSLYSQTYKNFKIIARDDGSSDKTVEILNLHDIEIMPTSDNLGAKGSFSALLEFAVAKNNADYFMFCDQDDIWNKDKIEKTLSKMIAVEKNKNEAVLIHTNLMVVDKNLKVLNNSFWNYQALNPNYKKLSYLIVQNNITGCTVMINKKLAKLALPIPEESIMHDWWLGFIGSEFGEIHSIQEPTILYRQHESNDTGAKHFNIKFLIQNAKKVLLKNYHAEFKKYIQQANKFLLTYENNLDKNSIKMLKEFSNIEDKNRIAKIIILVKYKLLKQGLFRNIGFFLKL